MKSSKDMKGSIDHCKQCGDALARGVCRRCVLIALFVVDGRDRMLAADDAPELVDGSCGDQRGRREPVVEAVEIERDLP